MRKQSFNCQANSSTNTLRIVPKENNLLHHCCPAFACGRRRHKQSWVVACRPFAAGHTENNARAVEGDVHAAGMMLGKGLNTVVERDKGSLVDTARSQLRRLAVEGRSDCTAVERVGNSLRFISYPCSTSCSCGIFSPFSCTFFQ